jgi:hypothetical protein
MANPQNVGVFLPTTNIWDVSDIYSIEKLDPALKELLVRLYQNLNNMSQAVNVKDSGMYVTSEFVNSQLFFQNPALTSASATTPALRQVFRKVINFGALPNTAAKSVAHGITITSAVTFTRIYGTATNPTTPVYIPLPYSSPVLANNIELSISSTNVVITTGSDRTAFTTCYVVVEYIKS